MTKEEIKASRSIASELELRGVHVNRAGFCQCIFHNEKTASMKLYPESNSFYCFGCSKSGDVFDVVMQLESVSFAEAFKMLGGNNYSRTDIDVSRGYSRRKRNETIALKKKKLADDLAKASEEVQAIKRSLEKLKPYSDEWIEEYKRLEKAEYRADCALEDCLNQKVDNYG